MIIALLVVMAVAVVLLIAIYRRVGTRLDAISRGLVRIENALGAEKWVELLEGEADSRFPSMRRNGIIDRLERIELAVGPMARAKHDVEQVMRELDEAVHEDPSNSYEHWQLSTIQEQIEKCERPQREVWESRIKTPFPWA